MQARIARGYLGGASEWHRAAIVFAFTKEPKVGGVNQYNKEDSGKTRDHRLSFTAFAKLGYAGLKDRDTVAQYWHQWNWAISGIAYGEAKFHNVFCIFRNQIFNRPKKRPPSSASAFAGLFRIQ
jgi:hypothetical protein